MKFNSMVEFYKINDDATVTVKVDDNYYRCKARFELLCNLQNSVNNSELKQGDLIECQFGLAYVRGQGLVLQLIKV